MSQGAIVNPHRAIPRFRLNNVTPFTYRDGLTYLQILESLRDKINQLVANDDELIESYNNLVETLNETIDQFYVEFDEHMEDSTEVINELVSQTVDAVNDAQALLADMEEISGLTGEDGAVGLLLSNPASLAGGAMRDHSDFVNARDFGVTADGVTDDRAALQSALDAATGGSLFIPSGTYRMSDPLIITDSNVTIYGEPGTTIDVQSFAFKVEGSIASEVAFANSVGSGDRIIQTVAPHGLAVGDTIRIISQRDALSADAGDTWRLGYPTPGSEVCYFAEWHQVMHVDSATQITLRTPILFPSYRADNSNEVHPGGRTSAVVQKMDTARNVTIRDINITSLYGTCIETRYAEDVLIESVRTFNTSRTGGASIFFRDSVNCKALNVRARYTTEQLLPADGHQRRNTFKTTGTQNCGFDSCYVENSSQCIDFTHDAGGTPSVFSYAINCEVVGSQDNCATAHGGTYGAQFIGNRFLECAMNGILNRSRSAVITGNTVIGRHYDDPSSVLVSYGIALYEGWARDCAVGDNVVHGFKSGITVWDAQYDGEWFDWVGATITGNVVTGCRNSIVVRRSPNNLTLAECGIIIADNVIRASATYGTNGAGIWLEGSIVGATIRNNVINGAGNLAEGINLRPNTHLTRVSGNRIMNVTSAGIRALPPTNPALPVARVIPDDNYFTSVGGSSSAHHVFGAGVEVWTPAGGRPGFARTSKPADADEDTVVGTVNSIIAKLDLLGLWAP